MTVVKDGISKTISWLDQEGGYNDLLGLATFARAEQIVAPLTRDRDFFEKTLSLATPETIALLNGTAIGYAIFKAATLTIACSALRTSDQTASLTPTFGSSIIILTDGLEEPHPDDASHPYRSMRVLQALRFAKENHVCVYYINIDKLSYQRMAPEDRDRLIEAVEATGGSYHEATNADQVATILASIVVQKAPEKTRLTTDNNGLVILALLGATLFSICLSRGLETTILQVTR